MGSIALMGGGSKGLAKLRRGCVGRTQAVGMVLLGASSPLGCSGCVCGSRDGCCGAGPSVTAARNDPHSKHHQNTMYFYTPFPALMVIFNRRGSVSIHAPKTCEQFHQVIGRQIKAQMWPYAI